MKMIIVETARDFDLLDILVGGRCPHLPRSNIVTHSKKIQIAVFVGQESRRFVSAPGVLAISVPPINRINSQDRTIAFPHSGS